MNPQTKCIALTAKGTQCKSNALDDNAFCGRHRKSAKHGLVVTAVDGTEVTVRPAKDGEKPTHSLNPLTQGKRGRQS